jgi:hypothetical protein
VDKSEKIRKAIDMAAKLELINGLEEGQWYFHVYSHDNEGALFHCFSYERNYD